MAEAAEQPEDEKKSGGMMKMIMLFVGASVLAVGNTFLVLHLTGGMEPKEAVVVEEVEQPPMPPIYLPIDPPFVVNFESDGVVRYLQVAVQLMARDQVVIDALTTHNPAIRNDLLLMLGQVDYATIRTREGKDALREAALSEIARILEDNQIEGTVEALYFTNFVIQ